MGEGPGEEGDVNYPLHSMDVSKHMLCVCEVQRWSIEDISKKQYISCRAECLLFGAEMGLEVLLGASLMPVPPSHPTSLSHSSTHLGISLPTFQLLHRETDRSSRVSRKSKGPHMSPQFPNPPKSDRQWRRTRKAAE